MFGSEWQRRSLLFVLQAASENSGRARDSGIAELGPMHANLMPTISYWGDTCHLDQGFDGSRCACGSWGSHKLTPTEPGASRPGGVGFFLTPPTRVSTGWRIIKSGIDCVISARAHGGSLFCVAGAHSSPFWRAQHAIYPGNRHFRSSCGGPRDVRPNAPGGRDLTTAGPTRDRWRHGGGST